MPASQCPFSWLERAPVRPAGLFRRCRAAQQLNEGDVEQLLVQTCRVLSSLTGYTAMAVPPAEAGLRVRTAHLAQTGEQQVLVVVVLDNGRVLHRFARLARALSPAEITC